MHVTSLERLSHVGPKSDDELAVHLCSTEVKLFSFLYAIQRRKNINSYLHCISLVEEAHFIVAFHRNLPQTHISCNGRSTLAKQPANENTRQYSVTIERAFSLIRRPQGYISNLKAGARHLEHEDGNNILTEIKYTIKNNSYLR